MLTKKMLKDAAECVALKHNMNKLEQTIRDLQLYNDVGWDEINDMFNLALTALRKKAERKLDDDTIEALRKHIKTLQKENNGWRERYDELDAGHSRLFKDFCKLQQENEQLRAQVTRMRKALTVANNYMPDIGQFCTCGKCKRCGADINYASYRYCLKCARDIINAALSDTPKSKEGGKTK